LGCFGEIILDVTDSKQKTTEKGKGKRRAAKDAKKRREGKSNSEDKRGERSERRGTRRKSKNKSLLTAQSLRA
jgi:hypothetical protein